MPVRKLIDGFGLATRLGHLCARTPRFGLAVLLLLAATASAQSGSQRSQAAPDIPTIGETLRGYDVPVWYGLVVTVKTPGTIINTLHARTQQALHTPEVKDRLGAQGVGTQLSTRAEFGHLIWKDATRWAKLVAASGIVLQ